MHDSIFLVFSPPKKALHWILALQAYCKFCSFQSAVINTSVQISTCQNKKVYQATFFPLLNECSVREKNYLIKSAVFIFTDFYRKNAAYQERNTCTLNTTRAEPHTDPHTDTPSRHCRVIAFFDHRLCITSSALHPSF